MKKTISFLLCIIMIFILCACNKEPSKTPSTASVDGLNTDITEDLSDYMITNGFDETFISYIEKHTNENFMVSPLSFRYAIGLLLAGADGDTKSELLKALKVESVDEWTSFCIRFNAFSKKFYDGLNSDIKRYNQMVKEGYIGKNDAVPNRAMRVANSVWKREDIEADFTAEYREYISKNYGAEYYGFTEKNAVDKINGWVNEKTEKMIPKLLDDNYNTNNLAVVLMNALYYKNNWVDKFEKSGTKDGDFHTKDGKTVKKSFMEKTENYSYYSDEKTQMVILPMLGGVNMAFVLGDTSNITDKITSAKSQRVFVKIPKMDIETSLDNKELMNFLKESGVKTAFDSNKADFSKMIDHRIWVDDIIQKTKIKTDENGVEAAAVTAIMTKDTACPITDKVIEFVADKPFSFYIYADCDDITAILFAGKVVK